MGKIPRYQAVMNQIQQKNEAKRRCRACNQLKPIGEFSLKNRKPRRVCKPCRALRGFRHREEEHREKTGLLIRELLRLSRRDRLRTPKAAWVLDELIEHCGNLDTAISAWKAQLDEALRERPIHKSTIDRLKLVFELAIVAKQAERADAVAAAAPASKRHNRTRAARDKPKGAHTDGQLDLAGLSDKELEAIVERYRQKQAADGIQGRSKAGRARGDGKG